MEVTVNDPARVTETTVDSNGRVSGLSDFKGKKIKLVVAVEEEENDGAENTAEEPEEVPKA